MGASPCMTPSGTVFYSVFNEEVEKTEAEIPLRRSTCGLNGSLRETMPPAKENKYEILMHFSKSSINSQLWQWYRKHRYV